MNGFIDNRTVLTNSLFSFGKPFFELYSAGLLAEEWFVRDGDGHIVGLTVEIDGVPLMVPLVPRPEGKP